MKIGILTYHDINNFGAQLQAAALGNFISKNGLDAEIIDYLPFRTRQRIAGSILRPFFRGNFSEALAEIRKRARFRRSILSAARISKRKVYSCSHATRYAARYDILICGSDELWNFGNYLGYLPPYILDMPFEGKKISYAASLGNFDPPRQVKDRMVAALSSFDRILVRDRRTREFAQTAGYEAAEVLDPTFLCIDRAPYQPPIENYLLVSGILDARQISAVFEVAEALGIQVVTVGYRYAGHNDCYVEATPTEWVGWIKNARYHITSLFHGAALSIQQNTNFVAYLTPGKEHKIISMLDSFNQKSRLIQVTATPTEILNVIATTLDPDLPALVENRAKESGSMLMQAILGDTRCT